MRDRIVFFTFWGCYCSLLSAGGYLAWRYIIDPFFDAVGAGKPWASYTLTFIIIGGMVLVIRDLNKNA